MARRHRLAAAARAGTVEEVVDGLVALHGTDPASVYLSALARLRHPEVRAVEEALYEQRSLVRMLGMRRTMFIVRTELAPVVQSSSSDTVAAGGAHLCDRGAVPRPLRQRRAAGWRAAAEPASEMAATGTAGPVLDVRAPAGWDMGHLERSVWSYVPHLTDGCPGRSGRRAEHWWPARAVPRLHRRGPAGAGRYRPHRAGRGGHPVAA
jgi:hypothetical protein